MLKLSNKQKKIKKLLITYYKVLNSQELSDKSINKKLKKIKFKLDYYKIISIKEVAGILLNKKKCEMMFKLWCNLVYLTGEL